MNIGLNEDPFEEFCQFWEGFYPENQDKETFHKKYLEPFFKAFFNAMMYGVNVFSLTYHGTEKDKQFMDLLEAWTKKENIGFKKDCNTVFIYFNGGRQEEETPKHDAFPVIGESDKTINAGEDAVFKDAKDESDESDVEDESDAEDENDPFGFEHWRKCGANDDKLQDSEDENDRFRFDRWRNFGEKNEGFQDAEDEDD